MFSNNKERALSTLITQGPMHRADLARALDVSRTTVTNLTQELISEGILNTGVSTALKTPIRITSPAGVLVSVVFRLRSTWVAIGSLDGLDMTLRQVKQVPEDRGAERLNSAITLVQELLAETGSPKVLAAHVAVNTQIDVRTGEVMGGRASRMWTGVNPLTAIKRALNAPVAVENTARLLALSEHLAHNNGASRNLVYVHLSYGITMGQVLHGSIVQGSHGGAGELGHMSIDQNGLPCECANRGCLMQYVDEKAVLVRAQAILGPEATLSDLLQAADSGSRTCKSLLSDVGTALGTALVNVCHLLDPDVIVVGGTLAKSGELIADPIRQIVTQRALPLNARGLVVRTASPSTSHGDVVAAGLHSLRKDPERVFEMVREICSSLRTVA